MMTSLWSVYIAEIWKDINLMLHPFIICTNQSKGIVPPSVHWFFFFFSLYNLFSLCFQDHMEEGPPWIIHKMNLTMENSAKEKL